MAAMDEMTFQLQLRELKQRVSDMANSSTPASSATQLSGLMLANAVQNDMFVAQLRDVTARLDNMQATTMPQGWREEEAQSFPAPRLNDDIATSWALSSDLQNLHTMVLDIDNAAFARIARLEQSVAELQRNTTFTPASSETTTEDLVTSQHAVNYEPGSEIAPSVLTAPAHQRSQDRPASLSQILDGTYSEPSTVPDHFMAVCPPKVDDISRPANLSEILNASSPVNETELSQHDGNSAALQAIASREREIANLYETLRLQTTDFENKMAAKDAELSHVNHCRLAAEEASQITRNDLEQRLQDYEGELAQVREYACTAGENFEAIARCNRELREARDKNIGRLTHNLEQCEASRHHFMTKYVDENYRFKWLEQRKLQSEQRLQQQLDDCEHALSQCENNRDSDISRAIRNKDEELEKLHVFCQEKDAIAWKQEELIAQGATILQERDAEIDRLNTAFTLCQQSLEEVMDRYIRSKRTIQDQDDHIEDLKSDVREEIDRRCRLQDLMRKDASAIKAKAKDVRFSEEEQQPATPFAQAAEAARSGKPRRGRSSWTPQPIGASVRLPHEENRASVWEVGDHSTTKHRFGSTSPIAQRRKQDVRRDVWQKQDARDDEQSQLSRTADTQRVSQIPRGVCESRPSQPLPVTTVEGDSSPRNLSQGEFSLPNARHANQKAHRDTSSRVSIGDVSSHDGLGGMAAQAPTNSGSSEKRRYDRHALPLDVTWLPPLPAPVSVERVGSVPDLRAGSHSRSRPSSRHGAISKPASMLDLRPSQQTYHAPSVETEAESAEDQGGSSLLDA